MLTNFSLTKANAASSLPTDDHKINLALVSNVFHNIVAEEKAEKTFKRAPAGCQSREGSCYNQIQKRRNPFQASTSYEVSLEKGKELRSYWGLLKKELSRYWRML